ncbi:hypothetical protein [Umezawaea sp. Da 62-37]|uniref:hypothetical protein n=1 Tax=Umezawaea sp. Da 62-37 TaxID=3075927 RepID=UPI0028F74324|nr:hypothetical protein [Umezawaea sp. Da 62-37]WNV89759.1 hypothetical protein RM788_16095 [Umezawaea sp. Da 62-37]
MSLTSGESRTDDAPPLRWSLIATHPVPLALRLTAAALGVGAVGGMVVACLAALFGAHDISLPSQVTAVGLPLVLVAMIGWRLAAVTDRRSPPGKRFAQVTAVSVVLIAAVQAWPEFDWDSAPGAGLMLIWLLLFGAAYGLVPAVVAAAVLVPAALLLRAARAPISLRSAQVWLTAFAMLVTGAFALWVTTGMNAGIVTVMATALAGTGAVLTARWCLVDRRP